MKKTNKWLVVMAIVIVIVAFTGITAFASNYDVQADTLKELGLFRGTDNGYELERIPTRAEAAVTLVRLLGKEAEAQTATYEIPFTDVPDWAAHYVGYLYTNHLTKGTTATTFGSSDSCNAQMFTTFVLRAIGYDDSKGDFTYSQAQEYAASIGLFEGAGEPGEFKRDDMVALSYSALFQPVKNSSGATLLEKLVGDNVVNAAAADKYMASYQTYQSLLDATSKNANATSMQMNGDTKMQITMNSLTQIVTQKMDIAVVQNGNDYIMKMDSTTDMSGTTQNTSMYYADGWMYIDIGTAKYKYQYALNSDELAAMTQQSGLGSISEPFYLIQSITKTDTGTGLSYKVVFSAAAMNDMLGSLLSQITNDLESANIKFNALEAVYSCDNNGNLQSILITGDIEMGMTSGQETINIGMTFQSTTKIVATGNAVTVTPPADLTQYETIENPEI